MLSDLEFERKKIFSIVYTLIRLNIHILCACEHNRVLLISNVQFLLVGTDRIKFELDKILLIKLKVSLKRCSFLCEEIFTQYSVVFCYLNAFNSVCSCARCYARGEIEESHSKGKSSSHLSLRHE